MNELTILGAGAFGIALARHYALAGHKVILYGRDENLLQAINLEHRHPKRFSDCLLPQNIQATSDLQKACEKADIVVSALPMSALRQVFSQAVLFLRPDVYIISTTKGIEQETALFSHELLAALLPKSINSRVGFLSGPSFAYDVMRDKPCAITLAAFDESVAVYLQETSSTDNFRVYTTTDVVGVEIGGAIKNVIAIAAGAAQGLELGNSALAALITRGVAEMTRLAIQMGAHPQTIAGLSGLGDLVLTCTGDLSRNRAVGYGIAQGKALDQVLLELGQVAEGVHSARSVRIISGKYAIEMPICEAVYDVLFNHVPVKVSVHSLMTRQLKNERI